MYHLDLLKVFTNLPQPHSSIAKQFLLLNFFIQDLCKYDLESHGDAGLIKVLLEHFSLSFTFGSFVTDLNINRVTSSYPPDYYCLGDLLRGDLGPYYLVSSLTGDSFLSSILILYFLSLGIFQFY